MLGIFYINLIFRFSVYASYTIPKPTKVEGVMEFNSGTIKIFTSNPRHYFKEECVHITLISLSNLSASFIFYFNNEKPLNFLSTPRSVSQIPKDPVFVNSKKYKSLGQKFKEKHKQYIEDCVNSPRYFLNLEEEIYGITRNRNRKYVFFNNL